MRQNATRNGEAREGGKRMNLKDWMIENYPNLWLEYHQQQIDAKRGEEE